ncbi:SMAD/FHA domain-containing protein [Ochromonadaceae sp. CCMP2298]|nr:SMAD/FHA domain-containing protein [Ochromonadaceae sp. CCMP2298]
MSRDRDTDKNRERSRDRDQERRGDEGGGRAGQDVRHEGVEMKKAEEPRREINRKENSGQAIAAAMGRGSARTEVSQVKEVWGKPEENEPEEEAEPIVKEKANFGLTGALAKDEVTGNIVKGVVLKWSEPLDSAKPDRQWRLYVFKGEELVETLHIHRQSSYLVGRDDRVADIVVAHPSCSKQHAVIQFRKKKVRLGAGVGADVEELVIPYLLDLQSAHKTLLNGQVVEDSRFYELREKDCFKFGASTREYVLLHQESDQA